MTEEQIFLAALDLTDAAARTAYLDEVCGADTGLRRQVGDLLRAHVKSGEFLDVPAAEQINPGLNPDYAATFVSDSMSDDHNPYEQSKLLGFLTPSTRPGALGRIGHYDVLQVLGQGAFGIVLRAFDDILQRVVAIKVLTPQMAATSPARKRFLREAQSSAQVRHEHVVQVHEVGEQPLPYLVMEFIPGETLQQRLDRVGPLDVPETLRIGRQIAEGLAAAHAMDLIHRDIKPGNILLEGGQHKVKITDFGLARAADDASMTQSGMIVGTPMYMAPEQALGREIDQRADLFSLGSVLYQMVAGRPPFRANATVAVLKRLTEDTPRSIREIIPETPHWLCDIIAKLHAKDPKDRYQSAREVADVLADCEAQLKANSKLQDFSRIPRTKSASSSRRNWTAAAVLLLPVLALAVTEYSGATHLLRKQTTFDPIKPGVEPTPVVIAIEETPVPVPIQVPQRPVTKVADAGGKGTDPTTVPKEKKAPPLDAKPAVEITPPAPSIHDTWLKAVALLPLDQHAAALPAKLKERLPGFEDALLRTIPNLAAERQAIMVAAWLRELNPSFEGEMTHKTEGGVLTSLEVLSPLVRDLTPLRTLPGLKSLNGRSTLGYDNQAARDAALLQSLKTLETINGKPVAQFWKDAEAGQAEFQEWLKLVPTLTAPQQVAAVVARLKERNPGLDGTAGHKLEGGMVTEFVFTPTKGQDALTDLSPVRALAGLTYLNLWSCVGLEDLEPLKGLKLTRLIIGGLHASHQVRDLEPLKGMKLTDLQLYHCQVQDLEPLKDMPLTRLTLNSRQIRSCEPLKGMMLTTLGLASCSQIQDFTPLQNLPLTGLYLNDCKVRDLEPFKGMKLTRLYLSGTPVRDLELLKGMPLKDLSIQKTGVTDLKPLQGMELEAIYLTPKNITQGLEILRDMQSLKIIGIDYSQSWPAAEFWERYDKGEFAK